VSLALEQLPLLVFAHLLAPFLDHAAHGITSKSRLGSTTDRDSSAESQAFSSRRNCIGERVGSPFGAHRCRVAVLFDATKSIPRGQAAALGHWTAWRAEPSQRLKT
jgi:hypothetical protein